MKKLFLTSLLAVFAVSGAQAADYFVGGAAGLTLNDAHDNEIAVSAEVGRHYNDTWDFGLGAELGYSRVDSENGLYAYGVNGFARYKLAQFGDFKLLLKGSVGLGFGTISSSFDYVDGETVTGLSASIVPMVTYDVSESFTLYANLNFLGFNASYVFENDTLGTAKAWNIGVGMDSSNVFNTGAFKVGFLYNF